MSIENRIRIVKRTQAMVTELMQKYPAHTAAFPELDRLDKALEDLLKYLIHLDQLAPNYTTNESDKYMVAINLDVDILKNEMEKSDYRKLQKNIHLIKVMMKFHPARYSFLEFAVIWIYEMIYFI